MSLSEVERFPLKHFIPHKGIHLNVLVQPLPNTYVKTKLHRVQQVEKQTGLG